MRVVWARNPADQNRKSRPVKCIRKSPILVGGAQSNRMVILCQMKEGQNYGYDIWRRGNRIGPCDALRHGRRWC